MSSTVVAVFLIASVLCVHSLPIDNKPKSSEIVTISKSLVNYLTDINNNTNQSTLFQLYRLADLFTKDELYRPEVIIIIIAYTHAYINIHARS